MKIIKGGICQVLFLYQVCGADPYAGPERNSEAQAEATWQAEKRKGSEFNPEPGSLTKTDGQS